MVFGTAEDRAAPRGIVGNEEICGRPAVNETGRAVGYGGAAVGQRSVLHGAGEPGCELAPPICATGR
jgi:hypothetical protein